MVARGELVGVLVCGAKQDNEVYAPDESDALREVAQGIGSALAVLSADGDHTADSLARELAELRATMERDRENATRERESLMLELKQIVDKQHQDPE
jgi:hypothetical protein